MSSSSVMTKGTDISGTGTVSVAEGLESAHQSLATVASTLDVDQLDGPEAVSLFTSVAEVLRLGTSVKLSLAARIDASGAARDTGHRNTASLVAHIEGVPVGAATSTVSTANRLSQLPATDEAMRQGRLSEAQARAITEAALLSPDHEDELLGAASVKSTGELVNDCRRVKAGSARADPVAAYRRVHQARSVTHWTDEEGALCLKGRFTPEVGAKLVTSLESVTNQLFEEARKSGSQEPLCAYRADALAGLVGGERPAVHAGVDVLVRVDHQALLRGRAEGTELAEVDGVGPLPVPKIYDLLSDASVKVIFEQGTEISRIFHFSRTINTKLFTALVHRDPQCVVQGCGATRFLEIDHVTPFAEGGPTTLANLVRLCSYHHALKSNDGYLLRRDQNRWLLDPPPPFGEEPGLGSIALQREALRERDALREEPAPPQELE